jgi:DNA invertase Pin-like site-specific DNA recombinase
VSEINVAQPALSQGSATVPRMGHLLGYARVATTDQHPQLQLDRLGRSLRHLVDTVTGLAERGIGFRSLHEAIDTTTPGGKLVFLVFAALAEFERDLIRERTTAGLAAARARGRSGGRPSVLTGHKLQVAREMYRSGQYTVAAIATTLGVSRASVYRHLSEVVS